MHTRSSSAAAEPSRAGQRGQWKTPLDGGIVKGLNKSSGNKRNEKELLLQEGQGSLIEVVEEVSKEVPSSPPSVMRCSSEDETSYCSLTTNTECAPIGRATQHAQVLEALVQNVGRPCSPRSVYVSGTPGTGKTMTVCNVLQRMRGYRHVMINCATVGCAKGLTQAIAKSLVEVDGGKNWEALRSLEEFARCDKGEAVIIVLDEIDLVMSNMSCSQSQTLYSLFELAAIPHSRLCLIAIANTADLPLRLLPLLRNSAANPTTIAFPPYVACELEEIARVQLPSVVQSLPQVAVKFAAKKAAAGGGDARIVQQMLRLAATKSAQHVGEMSKTKMVLSDMVGRQNDAKLVEVISQLPTQQQLVLVILSLSQLQQQEQDGARRRGRGGKGGKGGTVTLSGAYSKFVGVCAKVHVNVVPFDEFCDLCCGALMQQGLVDVARKVGKKLVATIAARPVRLRVPVKDVRSGVEAKRLLHRLLTNAQN